MQFDDSIMHKIKIDLPRLMLYESREYEQLKKDYNGINWKSNDIYLKILDVQLYYNDTYQFFNNNIMSYSMMTFFLNYLQTENLIKGSDLCKKLYFGFIHILTFDNDGNLEYDTLQGYQEQLILPKYLPDVFDEIILMIQDLGRWYGLYLNRSKNIGQLFDFKNNNINQDVYSNLQVLNEIIQSEFKFDIVNYDIRVLSENINISTDGGFFIINFLYKIVSGVQLENLVFNAKEKLILKDRLEWLILKSKDMIENKNNKNKKKGNINLNESDDILLDQSDYQQKMRQSQINSSKMQDSQNNNKFNKYDEQFSQNDSMFVMNNDRQQQSREPSVYVNKNRKKTKILTIKPIKNQDYGLNQSELQESFDYRSQNDIKQNNNKKSQDQRIQQQPSQYQESLNEDLESMWKFNNNNSNKQNNNNKNKQIRQIDQNEIELQKMWDFKQQYKKGMRQRNNQPMLIPQEHLELYRHRESQTSQQKDVQDKIIDIVSFLSNPENQDLLTNPTISYAVNRLKEQLGNVGKSNKNNDNDNDDQTIKTQGMSELKKIINEKMLENSNKGDLESIIEKQRIINDILNEDENENDRDQLEKRFENEINKIDQRFQSYMQKYDAMNQYQNLQSMYKNAYYAPPIHEIADIKDSMHMELQNYLLSGLGLPSQFSANPIYLNQLQNQNSKNNQSNQSNSNNVKQIAKFNQNSQMDSNLNLRNSYNNNSNNPLNNLQKNQSSLNFKELQQYQNKQQNYQQQQQYSPKQQKQQWLQQEQLQKQQQTINKLNQQQKGSNENQQIPKQDILAYRYNIMISQKQLIDILTQDRLTDDIIQFMLSYFEEKYFHENKRDVMIRDENRILLYPLSFYTQLSNNNPLVKQSQLNFNLVQQYTAIYYNNHTIFHEFDKLIIPIKIYNNIYTLAIVDLNVRQIIYFPIIQTGLNDNSNSNVNNSNSNNSIGNNSNNNNNESNEKSKQNNSKTILEDIRKSTQDGQKNAININILRYLEKEYQNKQMKNFQILNWRLTNINCSSTKSDSLSGYYMMIYIYMIYHQSYLFQNVNSSIIKQFKMFIPDVLKTIGITNNNKGEINYFTSFNPQQ